MNSSELKAFKRGYDVPFIDKDQTNPYNKSKSPKQWAQWEIGRDRAIETVKYHKKGLYHRRDQTAIMQFGVNFRPEKWM